MTARRPHTRFVLPVLALVLFGLLLTSPELLHAHRSGDVGLYSTECPLAEIAARHGEVSLASAPPMAPIGPSVETVAAVVSDHVLLLFVRSADSRAPPLA
jgi:hypothetical protein